MNPGTCCGLALEERGRWEGVRGGDGEGRREGGGRWEGRRGGGRWEGGCGRGGGGRGGGMWEEHIIINANKKRTALVHDLRQMTPDLMAGI